jgi:UDP-N-acetylmuramate dehydrogenase
MTLAAQLGALIGAEHVRADFSLSDCTSMTVGGAAEVFVQPVDVAQVRAVVRECSTWDVPLRVLGAGSNLVISDLGVRGVVLSLSRLTTVDFGAGLSARIAAGAMNAHAVRAMHKVGLVGAEFLALVPGQFGGAVFMNAGTRWGELSDILVSASVVTPDGGLAELLASQLSPSYRDGGVPEGAIVVSGVVQLERGDAGAARERVREEKSYRQRTQPYQENCSGSFFANPPGDAAGRLIEAAGLKGLTWGGAEVSAVHANFIVNRGGASATEVVQLMAFVRRQVRASAGVTLEPEVRLMGFEECGGSVGEFLDGVAVPEELEGALRGRMERV